MNNIVLSFRIREGRRAFLGAFDFQELICRGVINNALYVCNRDKRGLCCETYITDANGWTMVDHDNYTATTGSLVWDDYEREYSVAVEDCRYDELFSAILSGKIDRWDEAHGWLADWLTDGVAKQDSRIRRFVLGHPRTIEEGGFMTLMQLKACGAINEAEPSVISPNQDKCGRNQRTTRIKKLRI